MAPGPGDYSSRPGAFDESLRSSQGGAWARDRLGQHNYGVTSAGPIPTSIPTLRGAQY